MAFEDDRKARMLRDRMEKERQQAILLAAQNPSAAVPTTSARASSPDSDPATPQAGHFVGNPPSYETIHLRGSEGAGPPAAPSAISPAQPNHGDDSEEDPMSGQE